MADSNLNTPVIVQATRLDTSILPRNIFSQSYLLYVIAQGTDVGNVANKANEAGQGAYDAQVIVFAVHHQCLTKWVEWHRKTHCTNQQSYRFGM